MRNARRHVLALTGRTLLAQLWREWLCWRRGHSDDHQHLPDNTIILHPNGYVQRWERCCRRCGRGAPVVPRTEQIEASQPLRLVA